jgi:hypothetical protein
MDKKRLNNEMIEMNKKFNKALNKIRSEASIKDCIHPTKGECIMPIKSAHSLQKQGSLKILEKVSANGNAFIYSHIERQFNFEKDFFDLKPTGRKIATTFDGFCSYHDTELFKSIENEPEITDIHNDQHLFLHSYRSFAIAYHRKLEEEKLYESKDPDIHKIINNKYDRYQKIAVFEGVKAAINDFKIPKKKIDDLMLSKNYSGLEYMAIEYPYTAPVGCASFITPHSLPNGKMIQMDPYSRFQSSILTTILPFSDRTVVIFAAFPDDKLACNFLDRIDQIKHEVKQQKFLSFFIFAGAENVVVSPNYIDKNSLSWRRNYCSLIDHVADNRTPFLKYNEKKFHINYFDESNSLS